MSEELTDGDFYTLPDGREEALWMKPHRELIDGLSGITEDERGQLHQMVDAVYSQVEAEARGSDADLREIRRLLGDAIRSIAPGTPAPAASSPVPQAVTGAAADPSAAAAPVARDTGMCRCGHPIGEHDADGNGWCTGSTVWVDAQSDWLACDCKGYAPVGGAS